MTLSPELTEPVAEHDPTAPPQDLAAERSVLGAMMLSKDAITEVADALTWEHFYRPAHQAIYTAICDLYSQGQPADAITVAGELRRRDQIRKIGGEPYLHTLIAEVPTAANVGYYADQVLDAADRRNLSEVGTRLNALAGSEGITAQAMLEHAQSHIADAVDFRERNGNSGELVSSLTSSLMDDLQAIEAGENKGISTGFADLDALTNGFHPGQMITVGGRPGLGKSSLAMDFLRSAAIKQGYGAIMFNLEMGRSELMMRLMSAEAKVRFGDMRAGRLSDEDWTRIARRSAEVQDAPLVLDDTGTITPIEMASRARKWKRWMESRDIELGLIVVDYLQLVTLGRRAESREQEVGEISRTIKLLAKELEIPIVALSQLNRDLEKRADRKPQLSDLRESGALEQNSDIVLFVHRPDAYERDDPRMGEADLIVAKHRAGPTATITVAHQLHYSRFVDMAQE